MKTKIAIAVALLVVGAGVYLYIGLQRSPAGTASSKEGGLDVGVTYHRPFKKGRVIFGEKDALVPYNNYWRLGANQATEITFAKASSFAGKPIAAGTYRMYAVPSATSWKVVLNSDLGWGAAEPDHAKDVLAVEVPAEKVAESLEQFTISFAGPSMVFAWDTTKVSIPLAAN